MPVDPPVLPDLHRARRAVVVADMVESVRLMQAHEAEVIDRWRRFVAVVRSQVLPPHGGRLVRSLGDGMLLEFGDARAAAASAFALHRALAPLNDGRPADEAMRLRVGAHVAEIAIDELDIYGDGVNVAARVAGLAAPGEVVTTVEFADELLHGVDAELEDLGSCWVKGLDAAVHCWRIEPPQPLRARTATGPSTTPVASIPSPAAETAAPGPAAAEAARLDALLPRIAVMPLATAGLAGDDALAGHLVADSLTARLAQAGVLRVTSRLSAAALAGRALTGPEIAARLAVQYVVAGSIARRSGARWRVQLELIDGADGALVWTQAEDVDPPELLRTDDDFSAAMAAGLLDAIATHQLRRTQTHTLPTLQAYALQLAGLRLMHRAALDDFARARSVLEALVERHPRAPVPRAWLAQWWVLRTTRQLATAPQEEAAQALAHTRSALQADPSCALALATRGFIETHMQRDLDAAAATLDQALEANPNEALAWLYRSVVHGFRGEGEAAYRAAETASALSPLDPQRHYFDALTASAAITAGRHARGIELARRALLVNRNHLPTLRALTVALAETGDVPAAREMGARVLALAPEFTIRSYVAGAPKGAEATRLRFAEAFAKAGLPGG